MQNASFGKLNGFEAERLLYVLGVFNLHKYLIIISIPKKSLLNKFIISFLQCLQVWYCTYKIIIIISKINTVFPVPLYRESLLVTGRTYCTFKYFKCKRYLFTVTWLENLNRPTVSVSNC